MTVIAAVIAEIESMRSTAREGRENAIEESRHHKGAMESRYDTFKEEAQYLMAAQDVRLAEFESILLTLRQLSERHVASSSVVESLSLVELEDDSEVRSHFLILPVGGGFSVEVNGQKITTISLKTPLAQAMIGKSVDDDVELVVAGRSKNYAIVSVA